MKNFPLTKFTVHKKDKKHWEVIHYSKRNNFKKLLLFEED